MTETAAAPVAAKPAALWEDFVDVFTNPSAVFARRRDGRAAHAILLYTLLGLLTFYVARPALQPAFDKQIAAQVAKVNANPQIPAEQKEKIVAQMRGAADSPLAYIGPLFALPISLALTALALWGVGKGFGSAATYGQAFAVTALAGIPRAVLALLGGGLFSALGRTVTSQYGLTLSPAALLGPDASDVLAALLSRFDVGVLWHTALLGVGLAVVGKISRGKAMGAAAAVWVIGGLAVLVTALRTAVG